MCLWGYVHHEGLRRLEEDLQLTSVFYAAKEERFRCEGNNIDFIRVQSCCYRVR